MYLYLIVSNLRVPTWVTECGIYKISHLKFYYMSVDVDIYMNNIIKFFKQNEKDLLNLVPKEKEEEFYVKIREVALDNFENGKEVSLTRMQLIDVCKELNQKKVDPVEIPATFMKTKFGLICLN